MIPGRHCLCGFAASDPGELTDHLLAAFIPADGRAADGHVHEEATPALTCTCGYAATSPAELDAHFLHVFTPAGSLGSDGKKHASEAS